MKICCAKYLFIISFIVISVIGVFFYFNIANADTTTNWVDQWTFDTAHTNWSASTTKDIVSNNTNLSLVNFYSSTSTVNGYINQGLFFDGVDDYVTATSSSVGNMTTNDFSVSFWMKTYTTSTASAYRLVSKRGSGLGSWDVYTASGSDSIGVYMEVPGFGGVNDTNLGSNFNVRDTNWHHVVVVFDRDGNVTGYVDGVAGNSPSSISPYQGTISSGAILNIGRYYTGAVDQYNGYMDDVRIYNRALSVSDIADLYAGKPSTSISLAGGISNSAATLNGSITDIGKGDSTEHGFVYGTDSSFVNVTATTSLGAYTGIGGFSQTVSGLSSATTYYVRSYATNSFGIGYSSSQVFITYGNTPVISNIASTTDYSTATITWTTDINSDSKVEYGLTSSYTSSTTIDQTQTTSHSVSLTGLSASTTYHFRVVSNAGTSADKTFRTNSVGNVIGQSMFYAQPGLYNGYYYSAGFHYRVSETFPGYYSTPSTLQISDQSWIETDNTFYGDDSGQKTSVAANEQAIRLSTTTNSKIEFDFQNLAAGVYFIRVVGRADTSSVTRINEPEFLEFRINDGPNGEIHTYKMKVAFSNYLEEIGRIFFYGLNDNNNLHGELYLGSGSSKELLIHRIDYFDALCGATTTAKIKTAPTTFTSSERTYARANAPSNVLSLLPAIPHNLTGQDRIDRDDIIWNSMPPLNSMYAGDIANFSDWPNGLSTADNDANYGSWLRNVRDPSRYYTWYGDWDRPFKLVNSLLGLDYTYNDFVTHQELPGSYPFKDSGYGVYYATTTPYSSPGTYKFIVGPLVYSQFITYQGIIYGAGMGNPRGGSDLAYRYHLSGDSDTAWDGSLALVRWALQWPAMQREAQTLSNNSANPDIDWGVRYRWGSPGAKLYHHGGAEYDYAGVVQAYDYLYDYIAGNQTFADAIHRYIPWVSTPDDVIALLDTYLVKTTYNDLLSNRIEFNKPSVLGLILQNGSLAQSLMDLSKTKIDVSASINAPYKYHYHSSFNQDGTDFIGSLGYIGNSVSIIESSDPIARYKVNSGSTIKFDPTDLTAFPKIRSYANTFSDLLVAGGYEPSYGDTGGTIYQGPRISRLTQYVEDMWKYGGKNTKAGWYLANLIGRTDQSDSEWAEIVAASTTEGGDPRLHSQSRTFNGLGLGILETGINSNGYKGKSALVLRTGTGQGHAHYDALDLGWYAMGLRMGTDYAQRNEGDLFVLPDDRTSLVHNVVEVDGYYHPKNLGGGWPAGSFDSADSWIENFAPGTSTKYISASGKSANHSNVDVFNRNDALVDINATSSYIFDVFRVSGGQWHSWNFHGANTSGESDGFTVNTSMSTTLSSDATTYLRKFANGSTKTQGVAPSKLEATWRLGRTSTSGTFTNSDGAILNVTNPAAEQEMLGSDYNASSPRKYTKITLFDRAGDNVYTGTAYSEYYGIIQPNILVQSGVAGTWNANTNQRDDVYPAIIEAYAGTSMIEDSKSLIVTPNESDALKAVALVATTTTGRVDYLISDGRTVTRSVGDITYNGLFAQYSTTTSGYFGMMKLVGGTELSRGKYSIRPSVGIASSTIVWVNYASHKIYTNNAFPVSLAGRDFHIFNDSHRSSYKIIDIDSWGSGSVLTYENPSDIGEISVDSLSGSTLSSSQTWVLSGNANRNGGFTGTNESGTKFFKVNSFSGNYNYNISATSSLVQGDFTDDDTDGTVQALIYDFGYGDTIQVASNVTIVDPEEIFTIENDVDTDVTLPGGQGIIQLSGNKVNWTNLVTTQGDGSLTATVQGSTSVQYLRVINFPTVSISPTTNITNTAATLNGSIDAFDMANPTERGFEYGLTSSYGTTVSTNGSYSVGSFTANITSLSCNTSYHYRAFATDANGKGYSSDGTFVTDNQVGCDDSTAPVISSGSPSGAQSAGSRQITMSVTTNENSTCKYGTVSSTAYAAMPGTFSGTGATSHSTTVSGLSDGGNYIYYVRCADSQGNTNLSDYTISFSVSSQTLSYSGGGGGGGGGGSSRSSNYTLSISTSGLGIGSIVSTPSGISCNSNIGSAGTCSNKFSPNTTVNLKVMPKLGSYVSSWTGCSSIIGASTCSVYLNDSKNVVANFSLGASSGPALNIPSSNCENPVSKTSFSRDLLLGSVGEDVKSLQRFLNTHGFIVSSSGLGSIGNESTYFGQATKAALIKFQNNNKTTILTPFGLKTGTGYFGSATRNYINGIISKEPNVSAVCNKPVAIAISPVSVPNSVFTRNLTIGSSGDDVKRLQKFLNANGFTVTFSGPGSLGNESVYFGSATSKALSKFQSANNIVPANGFFGPITRSKINGMLK